MKELFELNKKIFASSILWISGFMAIGFSLYYFFFIEDVKKVLFITITGIFTLLFPLIILGIWTYDWFRKRKYKERILSKTPYSDLKKIGFINKTKRANHNGLLDFVDYGEINECQIVFDVDIKNPKVAEFQIYGRTWDLSSSEFLQKSKELNSYNIELNSLGFKKRINTNTEQLNSIGELEKILMEFTHIAKKIKYKSIPLSEWEHK